jgi:hypothetical protein
VVEDFPGNILILEPMKTVQRLHKKKKTKQKRDWKQNNRLEIWLSTSKRISKKEKKSRI